MSAVYFYHLTRAPLEVTLALLCEKARGAGWRILLRVTDDTRRAHLDAQLWLGRADGFLPHGQAGGAHDALQPVLLAGADHPVDGFDCIISVDGAAIQPTELPELQRAMVLFDGHDSAAVQQARDQWRDLTQAGCAAQYWSEESGSWVLKAQSSQEQA